MKQIQNVTTAIVAEVRYVIWSTERTSIALFKLSTRQTVETLIREIDLVKHYHLLSS